MFLVRKKGATPEIVKTLDNNLSHFAKLVEQQLGIDCREIAGAGAAGGLGFGLMVFTGAKIRSGVELVIEQTKLADKIAQADYVLTGEGKIDFQTKFGKTPFGVAQVAKQFNKPVIAFAGVVGDGIDELYDLGLVKLSGLILLNFNGTCNCACFNVFGKAVEQYVRNYNFNELILNN